VFHYTPLAAIVLMHCVTSFLSHSGRSFLHQLMFALKMLVFKFGAISLPFESTSL